MPVKLDHIAAGASAPIERQGAKARQDKWMLEIERAMLASGQPQQPAALPLPGVAADVPEASAAASLPAAAGASLRADARAFASAGPGRSYGAAPDDVSPAADRAAGDAGAQAPAAERGAQRMEARQPAAGTARSTGVQSMRAGAGPGDAQVSPGDGQARALAPTAAGVTGTGAASVGMEVGAGAGGTAAPGAPGAAPAVMPPPAMPGRAAVEGAASPPGTHTQPALGALAKVAPSAALPASVGPGKAIDSTLAGTALASAVADPAPEEEAPAQPEAGAHAAGGDIEPYQPRNVHVAPGEDGLHAWVRDAALTPRQEGLVAQAMVAQFVRQGAVVGSVSVNGRTYATRAEAEGEERESDPSESGPSTAAGTILQYSTVKGAA